MKCKWYHDNPIDIGNLDEGFCRLVPDMKCADILKGDDMMDCEQFVKAIK